MVRSKPLNLCHVWWSHPLGPGLLHVGNHGRSWQCQAWRMNCASRRAKPRAWPPRSCCSRSRWGGAWRSRGAGQNHGKPWKKLRNLEFEAGFGRWSAAGHIKHWFGTEGRDRKEPGAYPLRVKNGLWTDSLQTSGLGGILQFGVCSGYVQIIL